MKKLIYQLLIAISFVVMAFVLKAMNNSTLQILGSVFFYVGLVSLLVFPILRHISNKSSTKLIGWYLIIFIVLNILLTPEVIMLIFYQPKIQIPENVSFEIQDLGVLKFPVWFFMISTILVLAFKVFRTKLTYDELIRTKWFRFTIALVFIILALGMPIFAVHGASSGVHGHSFWDGITGIHMH